MNLQYTEYNVVRFCFKLVKLVIINLHLHGALKCLSALAK